MLWFVGMQNIRSYKDAEKAGENVGFKLITSFDLATAFPVGKPW
jgi:hypothetical protein